MIRSAGPTDALVLDAVCKSFGNGWAVDHVSFSVPDGSCFGLLGPNGAGKSTTLKMIYGFLRPSAGEIRVRGVPMVRPCREVRRLLGVVPQEDTLDPDLTVEENLLFHGRYGGLPRAEARRRAAEGLAWAELGDRGGEAVSQLSAGLRRRVALARALLNEPSILVLDEPTRGLDAAARAAYHEVLLRLKADGVAVVVATHDLEEAALLCDAVALMQRGRVVRAGEATAVLRRVDADGGADALETAG